MRCYQDGPDFYAEVGIDDENDKWIASYPYLVHGDSDTHGATLARKQFLLDYPSATFDD